MCRLCKTGSLEKEFEVLGKGRDETLKEGGER